MNTGVLQVGALAVVLLTIVLFTAEAVQQRDHRRIAKRVCYDRGYPEVMRVGERWYCARKRAGNDEIIEVKRLALEQPRVLP